MEKTIQTVEVEGKEYPVWYRHERDYERYHPQNAGELIIKGRTVALVEFEDDFFEAYAECSILDQYNRGLGRTIAAGRLKKALADGEYQNKMIHLDVPKVAIVPKPKECPGK